MGRVLECNAHPANKTLITIFGVPNCGRMSYKADRLNVLLNVGLLVATMMLGAIGALYWLYSDFGLSAGP